MKSFKKLRDFARQGGKNREKQANDGHSSCPSDRAGYEGGRLEPTQDAELITKGMREASMCVSQGKWVLAGLKPSDVKEAFKEHLIATEIYDARGAQKKYELLVNLSAEVSSCALGLSTAVHEMASYLAAPGVLDDQCQDVGRVFKLVGTVQFEISKSLELYASHVTQTVTAPTESLITELQNVMETKRQYDLKRQSLDSHRVHIARGRSRTGRSDTQDKEQLHVVSQQFQDVSRSLGDQILSLRQGRSQNLITQAARHHAAQMKLFSKGLISLHDIEPHIKQLTQELNIDRRLCSADMDDSEVEDDEVASYTDVIHDDGSYFDDADEEMDHRHSREDDLASGSSENGGNVPLNMSREWSSYMASTSDKTGMFGTSGNEGFDSPLPQWVTKGSKSTPTSPLATTDGVDGVLNSHHRHHHSVLPTNSAAVYKRTTKMGVPMSMFPPLDHSSSIRPMPLPLPVDTPPTLNFEAPSLSSTPRGFVTLSTVPSKKRYSYSGPLTSSAKPARSHGSAVPGSGPLFPSGKSRQPPGSPCKPLQSPRSTPATSPSKVSPPQIRELHKLPPPPLSASSSPIAVSSVSSGMIPHSAPLHRYEARLHAKTWT